MYNTNLTKVVKFLTRSLDSTGFDHLATNKNIILITRARLGKKIQATFHHSVVGIPNMSEEVNHMARSGTKYSIGIKFQLDTMFK